MLFYRKKEQDLNFYNLETIRSRLIIDQKVVILFNFVRDLPGRTATSAAKNKSTYDLPSSKINDMENVVRHATVVYQR